NDTATTEIYTLSLHDALPICGQPLHDERAHVDAAHEREAPVALEHRGEPAEVTHRDRIVEAELGAQVGPYLRRHVRVCGQLLEGIAGRQTQDGEQDEADPGQHWDHDQHPPDQILRHLLNL